MNVTFDDIDEEGVLNARLGGTPTRLVARQFGCTPARVDAVIDKLVATIDSHYRSRAFALECERLEILSKAYFLPAAQGDAVAAQVWCKLGQYRASLLGLVAPARSEVELLDVRASEHKEPVGLERLERALAQIGASRRKPKPEDDDAADD
jgi:hypothetical protein